jgi:hypothetical protein
VVCVAIPGSAVDILIVIMLIDEVAFVVIVIPAIEESTVEMEVEAEVRGVVVDVSLAAVVLRGVEREVEDMVTGNGG